MAFPQLDKMNLPPCPICGFPLVVVGSSKITCGCVKCGQAMVFFDQQWVPVKKFLDPNDDLDLNDEEGFSDHYMQLLQEDHQQIQDQQLMMQRGMMLNFMEAYRPWVDLAKSLLPKQDIDERLYCLIHALNDYHWNPGIWFSIAQIFAILQLEESARKVLAICTQLESNIPHLKQLEEKLDEIQIERRKNPSPNPNHDIAEALNTLGVFNLKNGKFIRARKRFEKALQLEPNEANKVKCANIYFTIGHLHEALGLLNECVAANSNDPMVFYSLGMIYGTVGDIHGAMDYFNRALKIDPKNHLAAIRLKQLEDKFQFSQIDYSDMMQNNKAMKI